MAEPRPQSKVDTIDRLVGEVRAILDREKVEGDVATAVLLDVAARCYAREAAEHRSRLLAAGRHLLSILTDHYAAGGKCGDLLLEAYPLTWPTDQAEEAFR